MGKRKFKILALKTLHDLAEEDLAQLLEGQIQNGAVGVRDDRDLRPPRGREPRGQGDEKTPSAREGSQGGAHIGAFPDASGNQGEYCRPASPIATPCGIEEPRSRGPPLSSLIARLLCPH